MRKLGLRTSLKALGTCWLALLPRTDVSFSFPSSLVPPPTLPPSLPSLLPPSLSSFFEIWIDYLSWMTVYCVFKRTLHFFLMLQGCHLLCEINVIFFSFSSFQLLQISNVQFWCILAVVYLAILCYPALVVYFYIAFY